MLGNRGLGNGQMVDNVAGDTSGMGHQKFDDLWDLPEIFKVQHWAGMPESIFVMVVKFIYRIFTIKITN